MDSTPLFKEDHRPALASAAAEYSKDRSAGNHRVLMSILSRCFQDGTHLTISYEPCEDENYSRQAMVEVHGKHFLLLFIHGVPSPAFPFCLLRCAASIRVALSISVSSSFFFCLIFCMESRIPCRLLAVSTGRSMIRARWLISSGDRIPSKAPS